MLNVPVCRIVSVALLCLTTAVPVSAGGGTDATIVVDKTAAVDFSPGFKLDCKHDITITISDTSVLSAVNPPAQSKGTKFKFQGKKPGIVNVLVEYSASQPNCSGFAAVRRNIEVTADLNAVEKDWKSSTNNTKKLIKAKLQTALKVHNRELNDIVKRYKAGQISTLKLARDEILAMQFGLWLWVSANISQCLGDLSFEAQMALVDNAIGELLPSMQLGSCESLYDDVQDDARSNFEKLTANMDARAEKAVKQMQKAETGGQTSITSWTNHWVPDDGGQPGPDTGTGPAAGVVAPTIVSGYAWREEDEGGLTTGLGYTGTLAADPGQTTVQVDVSGPNGYTLQTEEPLEVLAAILAGNNLDTKLSQEGARGTDIDVFRGATFGIELLPLTGGEGASLEPGSYRIEVRYPGESFAADTLFLTIP